MVVAVRWPYANLETKHMASIEQKAWEPTQWSVIDSKTNATATATRAAVAGSRHLITGVSISVSGTPAAALVVQVLDGATVLEQYQIPAANVAPVITNFVPPIAATIGNAVSVTVGAAGTGIVATVGIRGKTYPQ